MKRDAYNAYQLAYHKKLYNKLRRQFIVLLGKKCVRCGETKKLEFDHIDYRDKKFNVASGFLRYPLPVILREIAKCQLLCRDCHEKKSVLERGLNYVKEGTMHGTLSSYKYCRCSKCKAVKSAHDKEYNRIHIRKRDR